LAYEISVFIIFVIENKKFFFSDKASRTFEIFQSWCYIFKLIINKWAGSEEFVERFVIKAV
jgi:hypothetical protein